MKVRKRIGIIRKFSLRVTLRFRGPYESTNTQLLKSFGHLLSKNVQLAHMGSFLGSVL